MPDLSTVQTDLYGAIIAWGTVALLIALVVLGCFMVLRVLES